MAARVHGKSGRPSTICSSSRPALFTCRQPPHVDFDPAFYERLKATGLKAKLCWEAECEHLENNTRPIMTWDHWPEAWETADLTDYRTEFVTGREACQWIVDTLNGPEPAAIWGLSDGDVAWWCYDALAKLPDVDRHWLDQLAATSGLYPEDRDKLWPLFDEAFECVLISWVESSSRGHEDAGTSRVQHPRSRRRRDFPIARNKSSCNL